MSIAWFNSPALSSFTEHLRRIAHYPTKSYSTTYPKKSTKWMAFTSYLCMGLNAAYQTTAAAILSIRAKQIILQTGLLHSMVSTRVIPIVGAVAAIADTFLETQGIIHCVQLKSKFPQVTMAPKHPPSLLSRVIPSSASKEEQKLSQTLNQIHEAYFTLDHAAYDKLLKIAQFKHPSNHTQQDIYLNNLVKQALSKKRSALVQCVGKPFADELEKTAKPLSRNLTSYFQSTRENGSKHATALMRNMQTQSSKSALVHGIGLASSLTLLGAFILTAITAINPILPLALNIAGLVIFVGRYVVATELMRTKGWTFSLTDALKHSFITPVVSAYHKVFGPKSAV